MEVFHRYLDEKLNKLYQVNDDNLFVIIDSLMTDGRWDMKFLGMQIMVEGLALGFGTLYKLSRAPPADAPEDGDPGRARHVRTASSRLPEHHQALTRASGTSARTGRVALLMRNRFLAYEVYEEWFEGASRARTGRRS